MYDTLITRDWIPLNKRDHLSFIHICGIAAGTLVANLLWTVIFTLFEPLSERVKLKSWIRTFLLFYGSFAGFIINPILGVYSDALTFKWGRRRIFMLIGGIILVGGLFMMMYCIEIGSMILPHKKNGENEAQKGVLISAMIIVFTAGNIVQAPARTLCSDVTPLKQQILMSNICQVYSGIGGVLTNLIGGLELYKYTKLDQEPFILVICLSISAVSMAVTIIVSREEPLHEKPPPINPFKQIFYALKRMPKPFVRVLFPFTLAYISNYQYGFQFSHFMGKQIFHGSNDPNASKELKDKYQQGVSWSMMCNVVYCSFQFAYGFLNTWICDKIGMKSVMALGLLILSGGLFSFFFVSNKYAFLGLTIPLGIGNLIYTAIAYTVVSMVIPTEDLGANLGILTCFGVIGQQISNFGIGTGLAVIWPDNPRMMISISSVVGFIAFLSTFFMINPGFNEINDYQRMTDKSIQETSIPYTSSDRI